MRVEVSRDVAAPPAVVWDVLTDWERQPDWMVDARAVEVLSDHREGVGVQLRTPTRVLGVTVEDRMRVTTWCERQLLGVRHTGRLIVGEGAFELVASPAGTRVVWWEEIDPPLGPVGELVARLLLRPYLTSLFGRSLAALQRCCERAARHDGSWGSAAGRG
ncbi:MAG TPA: SRPBCC family protein [Nitriliruptorales bacterium]|nr:SRPBCC family protein [Nitriliruptorales bacterium]